MAIEFHQSEFTKMMKLVMILLLDDNFYSLNIIDIKGVCVFVCVCVCVCLCESPKNVGRSVCCLLCSLTSSALGAEHFIRELVKIDHLPKAESLEGLMLIRDAWDEYDITMSKANEYKIMSLSLYATLLALGVATVTCSVLKGDEAKMLVFLLAVSSSLVLSIVGLFKPGARWRQLRSCAVILESMIWKYRARAGPFRTGHLDSKHPEAVFAEELRLWREELVAGQGDVAFTTIGKQHSPSTFKHGQRCDILNADDFFKEQIASLVCEHGKHKGKCSECLFQLNDHHSPIQPESYIQLRLLPMMLFYQRRIPRSVQLQNSMQVVVFACSALSAIMTFFDAAAYVAVSMHYART